MEQTEINGERENNTDVVAIAPEEKNLIDGYVFGETYPLSHGRLSDILNLIHKKGNKEFEPTHQTLLSNGIYIGGKMNLFMIGSGSRDERGYIARIVDGAVISRKPSSLYLQMCVAKSGWEVNSARPNLVKLLREFII